MPKTYRLMLTAVGFCMLAVLFVPSTGFSLFKKKSAQISHGVQTNDFGARTMFFIVSSEDSRQISPSHSLRVRRDAIRPEVPREPKIHSLLINAQITARFAETKVESHIENDEEEDLEALFTVQLPETAFISNFTMIIDGIFYTAKVDEKSKAEEAYTEAKEKNKTAGHVSASQAPRDPIMKERGMEVFNIAINIKAKSAAELTVTYQQLLVRDLGIYEYIASVRPRQIVDFLTVNIKLYEPQGVRYLDVYEPGQNSVTEAIAKTNRISSKMIEVSYSPDRAHQKLVLAKQAGDHNGMDGDFIVRYDVSHGNKDAGHLEVDGGFFVHYFSPSGLDAQPKNIIFVIDRSGSMSGEKLQQTKEALLFILDYLRPSDSFQMIYFDSKLNIWAQDNLVEASPDNIGKAKNHIREHLKIGGSTNINSALLEACRMLRHQGIKGNSFIVFLTDGHPTAGETSHKQIARNVAEAAAGEVVVFSLGFGFDLNFDLLKDISYRTEGTVRRIYPGRDAGQQIKDFLSGVNTPLLYEIHLQYDENAIVIDSLTQHSFPQYFNGSEIIVAGKLTDNVPPSWSVNVVGVTGENEQLTFEKDISSLEKDLQDIEDEGVIVTGFAERLWAYLTIKDLLKQRLITDDYSKENATYQKALHLALQYKLVTPVTSLIITEADYPIKKRVRPTEMHSGAVFTSYNKCAVHFPGSVFVFLTVLMVLMA